MIFLEALGLPVAAVIGGILGVLATRAVLLVPAVSSFLEPGYTLDVFVSARRGRRCRDRWRSLSCRARRAPSPMEALRYE